MAAELASSHMYVDERQLAMDDVQRDLETRLSSFFNNQLIPLARKKITEMQNPGASAEASSVTDDDLGSIKDQMQKTVAESAEFRVHLQALGAQVDSLRAECQESHVESITAMVRDELEKGRMDAQTKMDLLHGTLRREIDSARQEAHQREALVRDVLRREFCTEGLPARLGDTERTTAELVTVLDAMHKRIDKVEKDVAELVVGSEAMQANVQQTIGQLAAEVSRELDSMRSLYPPPAQPREENALALQPTSHVDQLAEQVADIRQALHVLHEEIKEERQASLGFAARATQLQVDEQTAWKDIASRTSELEEVVHQLDAKTEGVISTLREQEREVSETVARLRNPARSRGIVVGPIGQANTEASVLGLDAHTEKRLEAMEKAMANLSMEVMGERYRSGSVSGSSTAELPGGNAVADDIGRRLVKVEKALGWLQMEALGKSSSSRQPSEASMEALQIDRTLAADVSEFPENPAAVGFDVGVDGFAKRMAGVEKAVRRLAVELIGERFSSPRGSEFSVLEGAQSSARRSSRSCDVLQAPESTGVEQLQRQTSKPDSVESLANLLLARRAEANSYAERPAHTRALEVTAGHVDTSQRSVDVQVDVSQRSVDVQVDVSQRSVDVQAGGEGAAAAGLSDVALPAGERAGSGDQPVDPDMALRVETLERQVNVINAEVGIEEQFSLALSREPQVAVAAAVGSSPPRSAPQAGQDAAMMGRLEQLIEVERSARRELEAELRSFVQLVEQSKASPRPGDTEISAAAPSPEKASTDDPDLQARMASLEAYLKDMWHNANVLRNAVSVLSYEVLGEEDLVGTGQLRAFPIVEQSAASSTEDLTSLDEGTERRSMVQARVDQLEIHLAGLRATTEELKSAMRALSAELAADSHAAPGLPGEPLGEPRSPLREAPQQERALLATGLQPQEETQPAQLRTLIEAERLARLELETQLNKVSRFVGCTDEDFDAMDAEGVAPVVAGGSGATGMANAIAQAEASVAVQVTNDIPDVADLRAGLESEREQRLVFAEDVGAEFAALRQALEHERAQRLEVTTAFSDRHSQHRRDLEAIMESERKSLLGFAEEVGAQHSAHCEQFAVQREEHEYHQCEAQESRVAVSELREFVDRERMSRLDVIQTLGERHKELLHFIELERSELARLISAFEVENAARQRLEAVVGSLQDQLASTASLGPNFAKTLLAEREAYCQVFQSVEAERESWQQAMQLEDHARAEARREMVAMRDAIEEMELKLENLDARPALSNGSDHAAGEAVTVHQLQEEMEVKLQVLAKPQAEIAQLVREEVASRQRIEDKVEALWREFRKLAHGTGSMRNRGMVRAPQLAGLVRGVVNSAYIRAQGSSPSSNSGSPAADLPCESAEAAEAEGTGSEARGGDGTTQRVQRRLHGSAPSVLETDADGARRREVDLDSTGGASLEELARVVESERLARSEAEGGFPSFRRCSSNASSAGTGATAAGAEEAAAGQPRSLASHGSGAAAPRTSSTTEGLLGDILAIHEEAESIIMQHVRQVTERCHARVDALTAVVQRLQHGQPSSGSLEAAEGGSQRTQGRRSRSASDTAVQGPVARAILASAYGKATSMSGSRR